MKEIVLNNFGATGAILYVVLIYIISCNLENKWAEAGLWILAIFSMIGLIQSFDFIGKWLLK